VNYLFLTNHGSNEHPELVVQPFDANTELNDYEVSHASLHRISFPIGRRLRFLFSRSFHLFRASITQTKIPWALRELISDERVAHFFANDFANLRNAFPDWHPKTAILRDLKRKLQPIQRLNADPPMRSSPSKL
jgi:hypothetical protein